MYETIKPGEFCWQELLTSNVYEAKRFYSNTMEWKFTETDIPGDGLYHVGWIEESVICGIYEIPQPLQKKIYPRWESYIFVQNVHEVTSHANKLGAGILQEPMKILDMGEMSTVIDPTGAVISFWKPTKFDPMYRKTPKKYDFGWSELLTRNIDRAGKFYHELLGWNPKVSGEKSDDHITFWINETPVASLKQNHTSKEPSQWLNYIHVLDPDSTMKTFRKCGADVISLPEIIFNGRKGGRIKDPQGALIGYISFEE